MIQRSLSPAKVSSIIIDEEKKTASVYLKPEEVSLAIGKGGLNIRLSKLLTGYDIDVYREIEEEDVALTEFADEIEGWIIEALKARSSASFHLQNAECGTNNREHKSHAD